MPISKETKKVMDATLAKINKQFGDGAISYVSDVYDKLKLKFYETPSPEVNAILGGGFVAGRSIELAGNNSCGKTSLALETIAFNQKKYAEKGEDFICGFFETEESWDPEYAKMLGVDTDKIIYWDQKNMTAEDGFEVLRSIINSGVVKIIVINSVSGLIPKVESDGDISDSQIALQARLMSKALRVITGSAAKNNVSLIWINQLRTDIGVKFGDPNVTSGR